MAKGVNTIHDKFVRDSFSDPVRAVAFLEKFLPQKMIGTLDLSTLKVIKESYISGSLQEHFSDLVYEVDLKDHQSLKLDISLLFEHKSSPDKHVLIQVGHYIFAPWFNCISGKKPLKVIIPLIYYQGKQEWKLLNLIDLFKEYPDYTKDFVPEIKHLFIALNSFSVYTLTTMRDAMMTAALIAQRWRINPVKLHNDFARIFKLFPEEGINWNFFFEKILVYALNVSDITKEGLAATIKDIPPTFKDNIMTTYTRIIQSGKIEGKIEVVLNCFDQDIALPMISNITNMSIDKITSVLKENGRIK